MKLKLAAYKTTTEFSSRDIRDNATEPPLVYEVYTNRPDGFTDLVRKMHHKQGDEVDNALQLVGLTLVSVSVQGVEDSREPIGSVEQARELMQAIERMAPGQGEGYIKNLAGGIVTQQLEREEAALKNYAAPSPPSGGGANGAKSTTETG